MPAPLPTTTTLGSLLRRLRTERNLTQEVLADLSGVPVSTISRTELGQVDRASLDVVLALAAGLGIAAEVFIVEYETLNQQEHTNATTP